MLLRCILKKSINNFLELSMAHNKYFVHIAHELGLNFTEEAIDLMVGLLESGVTPDNLLKILENSKNELKSMQ